ncbi:hypothetical protein LTR17_010629 [Elasticomyces elasticus]|nr:hypothetical protein LTR17_010629 [Elasticomyces elasticus]
MADQVFNVPELLEMILLQLPCKDLHCTARDVCKTWRAMITDSSRIRRAGAQHDVAASASSTHIYTVRTTWGTHVNVTLNPLVFCTEGRHATVSKMITAIKLGSAAAVDHQMFLTQPPKWVVVQFGMKLQGRGITQIRSV